MHRYYENNDGPWHRKRWVLYKDTFDYNPTSVPAEWHGWLEGISDFAPTKWDYPKPIYKVEHYISRTGTPECYNPKGAWVSQSSINTTRHACTVSYSRMRRWGGHEVEAQLLEHCQKTCD